MGLVWFEDYTINDDCSSAWAYICPECVKKYGISKALLSDGLADGVLCSVDGCKNEAGWYLDFPKEAGKPTGRVFGVTTNILQQTAAGAKSGLTVDQINMFAEPLQDLKRMNDPLEPIKVVSALRSKCMVLEYRKKHSPKDISILDYADIAALWKQVPEKPKLHRSKGYICPECGYYVGNERMNGKKLQPYCENCGQRLFWADEEKEVEQDGAH